MKTPRDLGSVRRASARRLSAALVTTLLALPSASVAQTVLLRVTNTETAAPVFGAIAHLIDERGVIFTSVLTDEQGRALFVSVPPARYRLRAEMIGLSTQESELFDVGSSGTQPHELGLAPRAIDLEAIDVRAERRRCTARPTGEGLVVARLWEEVRKALSAAAITDLQGLYRYETMTYERDVNPATGVIVRSEESSRQGYMRSPFTTLPPEDLVQNGFVRRERGELLYYAPDAEVLLSDPFLDTHCFRLAESSDDADEIGLEFEPLERRGRIADVGGTLWMDRETSELRWLEYTYYNLDLQVRTASANGRVEFERMPSGKWIVPEWWIDMPIVDTRFLDDGSSRVGLSRIRRSGGRVLQVHEAGGRSLGGRNPTGGVEGIVVDSVGAPVAGVRVGAVGWNQEAFTDGQGAFGLLGMREGRYDLHFVHPRLAALGFAAPLLTREVIPGEVSYVEFHIPSVGELLSRACSDRPDASAGGAVVGRVIDSTGLGVVGATVRATWVSTDAPGATDLNGVLVQDRSGLETTTDASGAYRLCGVPRGVRIDVSSILDGQERSAQSLIIERGAGALHQINRRN
jgi:hypothetical protein